MSKRREKLRTAGVYGLSFLAVAIQYSCDFNEPSLIRLFGNLGILVLAAAFDSPLLACIVISFVVGPHIFPDGTSHNQVERVLLESRLRGTSTIVWTTIGLVLERHWNRIG